MLLKGFNYSDVHHLDSITTASTYINKANPDKNLKIVVRNNRRLYIELSTKNFEEYVKGFDYLKSHKYKFVDKSTDNDAIWLNYTNYIFQVTLGKGTVPDIPNSTFYDISIEFRKYQ